MEDLMKIRGRTFEQWKRDVNGIVERMVGLSVEDMPDQVDQWEMWESGMQPGRGAQEILVGAGYPTQGTRNVYKPRI